MELLPEREKKLREIEKKLGTSFLNKNLLNQALTHSSYAHENNLADNERMEFLGDAVLKLATTESLYHKFPERNEGDLTKIRAVAISDETLAVIAEKINLGEYLLLSAHESQSGGQKRKSNLANAFEAIIGALYLDAGLGKTRDLINHFLHAEIETISRADFIRDYKSALQEFAQKHKRELPHYRVVKESGPKHHRVFWIEVKISGKRYGIGRGANKKEAEQRSAAMALRRIKTTEKKEPTGEKKEPSGLRALIAQIRKKSRLP
jgi:ribonuclease-3